MTFARRVAAAARVRIAPRTGLAAVALFTLGGCAFMSSPSSHPTEFFVLAATAPPREAGTARRLFVGIGPISLPAYLQRPEMVTRVAENQLVFDEFNRWAEPLKNNFTHVLATDLDTLVGFQQVVFYPWYDTTPIDYAVGVAVLRFERESGGNAVLVARWEVRNRKGEVLSTRESRFSRPADDPTQTAAALSAMTADLTGEIAAAMRGLDVR